MRTNSIKTITLAAKKIMLQKKILNFQKLIKDIDEAIEEDITYKSDFEDFERLYEKLIIDFHDILNDKDKNKNNNKIQVQEQAKLVVQKLENNNTKSQDDKIENVKVS